ncbi:hypothetical protein BC826DRAFT_982723 [Russula brevipes]|nr:hypothetical protein BC826DRAFT_982723 [Russula brevipes]
MATAARHIRYGCRIAFPIAYESDLGDTLVLGDIQQDQEQGNTQDSQYEDDVSWEQHYCADCGKRYRRAQELRRHARDKHEQQRKCPFCDTTWSRPEKIRAHLLTEHGDQLTEEENQELRSLRGRHKTIHFLAKFATATPPL